jgi:outer membrane protein assembly factor BamB
MTIIYIELQGAGEILTAPQFGLRLSAKTALLAATLGSTIVYRRCRWPKMNHLLRPLLAILLLAPAACCAAEISPAGLARFLPNNGNNVYPAQGLLRKWPEGGPKLLWRADVGLGKSGIAESQGRIYTLTQIDEQQFAIAMDAASGKVLWKRLLLSKGNHHGVDGPVSSPLLDGDRLYVFPYDNERGDLWHPHCPCFCLGTKDGEILWSENKRFNCSEGTTPLIVGDALYVGGGGRENILAAVDKRTGKLLWKTAEDHDAGHAKVFVTGASLTYQEVAGIPQIVVAVFRDDMLGVHAKTGRVLWHWKLDRATQSGIVPTPVAIGNRLLLSAFQAGKGFSQCLEITAGGGSLTPHLVYESDHLQCNTFHTPSVHGGVVFGFGKGAQHDALQCTRWEDGRLLWQDESRDWGRDRQLTVADDLILAITRKGEIVLAEATTAGYRELSRFQPGIEFGLPQQPMIVGGRMYLRGNDTIACYAIAKTPGNYSLHGSK